MLGFEHPETLSSMSGPAWSFSLQGRIEEVFQMQQHVLALRREVLGSMHLDVSKSMNCIAELLSSQGKVDEAIQMYQQTFELQQQALGADHPYTLDTKSKLDGMISRVEETTKLLRTKETLAGRDISSSSALNIK